MAEIGRWNNHVFTVSPSIIRSFSGLSVKGSSETEEKETGGQKYVNRKSGKPAEVSVTILLSALTGNDVRKEALAFVDEARRGTAAYFYIGGKKLVTCQLMLTDANVSEVEIASGGVWVSCKVQLTMKQSSKYDGESSGSSGGKSSSSSSKKTSTKKKTTTTKKTNTIVNAVSAVKGAVTGVVTAIKSIVSKAQSTIKKLTTAAKSQSSSTKKKTTTTKKVTSPKIKSKIKAKKK